MHKKTEQGLPINLPDTEKQMRPGVYNLAVWTYYATVHEMNL